MSGRKITANPRVAPLKKESSQAILDSGVTFDGADLPPLPVLVRLKGNKQPVQKAMKGAGHHGGKESSGYAAPQVAPGEQSGAKIKSTIQPNIAPLKQRKKTIKRTAKKKTTAIDITPLEDEIAKLRSQVASLQSEVSGFSHVNPKNPISGSGSSILLNSTAESFSAASRYSPNSTPSPTVYELREATTKQDINNSSIFAGLLDRARLAWFTGDWEALSNIDLTQLAHHPDRAQLTLLASIGHNRCGRFSESRRLLHLAIQWGCDRAFSARLILASAHRSVAQLMRLNGLENKAQLHLNAALSATGDADLRFPEHRLESHYSNQKTPSSTKPGSLSTSNLNIKSQTNIPRLIIAGGLVRSGSTVLLNIVIDLLRSVGVDPVKYFSSELKDINTFRDHLLENKGFTFILKTHDMQHPLPDLCREMKAKILLSVRNIFEISASYIRMAQNPASEFYQTAEFTLDQLCGIIRYEIEFFDIARKVQNCIILDCKEISSDSLQPLVSRVDRFLELGNSSSRLQEISDKHRRTKNAVLTAKINPSQFTSLKHDSETFYHKNHVLPHGTKVEDYLSDAWKREIISRFSQKIDYNGFLIY